MRSGKRWLCFWALLVVVIIIAALICIRVESSVLRVDALFFASGIALLVVGGALVFFTVKEKTRGRLRILLILTGASAVGTTVGVILHNAVYGILIFLFGAGIWERIGVPDEPVFFVLALIVCPIGFLIGSIGTIVYSLKHRHQQQHDNQPIN